MCHENSSGQLSTEEGITPEESLLIYCKPVELYNILHNRAFENPPFLQRCLRYKKQARCIRRSGAGTVIFNYRCFGKTVQKIEVTEDFSCPFCLMQCASFEGLRYHLCSSHDLFNFEFWVTEEYLAVNVSVKIDLLGSEVIADGIQPQQRAFFFSSKRRIRIKSRDAVQNSENVLLQSLEDSPRSDMDGICEENMEMVDGDKAGKSSACEEVLLNRWHEGKIFVPGNLCVSEGIERVVSSFNTKGASIAMAQSYQDPDFVFDLTQPTMVQSVKARKLSAEQSASRNRELLQKRQFFHSHRAQPMPLEHVLSGCDSEDEVDEIADLEDQRMLDDFVDVGKDEKHFMHLWNSFVRKQRVLADGHVPWACKAFSELHGLELVQVPAIFWCWRLFMIKLWNHGLLDASTMNDCNTILENHKVVGMDAMSC